MENEGMSRFDETARARGVTVTEVGRNEEGGFAPGRYALEALAESGNDAIEGKLDAITAIKLTTINERSDIVDHYCIAWPRLVSFAFFEDAVAQS
jgi:hypothetical protein